MPANIGGTTFALACLRLLVFGLESSSSEAVTDRVRFRDFTGAVDDWSFTVLVSRVTGKGVEAELKVWVDNARL